MAGWTRLELATFCVTGRRSNQLSYHPVMGRTGTFSEGNRRVKPVRFSPRLSRMRTGTNGAALLQIADAICEQPGRRNPTGPYSSIPCASACTLPR